MVLPTADLSNKKESKVTWMKSFAKTDPRWNIMRYFQNFVMQYEVKDNPALLMLNASNKYGLTGEIATSRPAAFSVWRTTSMDAIRLMMTGKGTGKGLDIKGKSAIRGKLSGFVPFVQIHNNDEDKKKVGTCLPDIRVKIFYSTKSLRDEANVKLKKVMLDMVRGIKMAKEAMGLPDIDEDDYEEALQKMTWKMTNPKVIKVDDYGPEIWGLDIPERLLWEAYIMRGDCTRVRGSEMDTGKKSQPQFFAMNLHSLRDAHSNPRPVLWQTDFDDPMNPMTLLMAYEENNNVTPVVSDFDPFLIGTRGVPYEKSLRPDQVIALQWCIKEIEGILKATEVKGNWTQRWLRVVKKSARQGFHPQSPRYGFGDPMSYTIIKNAVEFLSSSGAVRHGSEAFNFYFPQAMDEEFLVVCPEIFGDLPYKYMNQYELRQFLMQQIELGFTFPLHPKWVLCDPGWIDVWNALNSSNYPYVQQSLDVWYPPESDIREKVNAISLKYPKGFRESLDRLTTVATHTNDMELAKFELKRYLTLQRAKSKLRIAANWKKLPLLAKDRTKKKEPMKKKVNWQLAEDFGQKQYQFNIKSTDLLAHKKIIEKGGQSALKYLEEKEHEVKMKEKNLVILEREMNAKLKHVENGGDILKLLEEIKSREHQLQLKEISLKVKESRLEMMELEINMKLQKLVAREKEMSEQVGNSIQTEMKEIEVWRKASELQLREVELNIRSEKLTVRENEVSQRITSLS